MKKKIVALFLCVTLFGVIGCSSDGVSQEEYDKVVRDLNELQSQLDESEDQNNNENVSNSENKDGSVEVVKEYLYMRDDDNARYFLVLKNNSDHDLSADISVTAKDASGNPIGVEDGIQNSIASEQEVVTEFYFDEAESVDSFEYSIDAYESEYVKSQYDNLSYETNVNGSKLIVTITNNGSETAENVSPHALFFNNGEIFSHEYSGYEEIGAGETKSIELECFDGEFEDFELYIESWSME